jgi:rare lipoprotein A
MNKIIIFTLILLFISGCSTRGVRYYGGGSSSYNNYSPQNSQNYTKATMRPYTVRGITYYPTIVSVGDEYSGRASWYGPDFDGKQTSSGETYNMYEMTAAHKTLPMNTIVQVTNQENGKSIVVRINDRGPFVESRIIDLSKEAATRLNIVGRGTAMVSLKVLGFGQNASRVIPNQHELDKGPKHQVLSDFSLQIGSFSNINGAIATQKKYNGIDGYKTLVKDIQNGDKRAFKVWLGGFQSEAEARDYSKNGKFKGAFIIKE